tara:strand:+ start:2180 stop:2452 length:273 start_codon:yes stop_codon:yes gene_type:complete
VNQVNKEQIQRFIDEDINPSLANHGGWLRIHHLDEQTNDIQIELGGGCQGCAASGMTIKAGVEFLLREKFPEINSITDVTKHDEGINPFY